MGDPIDLTGKTVLLVEDDELIRDDLDHSLRGLGAVTACTGSVGEAMALAERDFTHAILDVRLSDGHVHPVADRLAARRIPFTFYSASARCDGLSDRFPAAAVVPKPALPHRLAALIASPSTEDRPS